MRLFIALRLPEKTKQNLRRSAAQLADFAVSGQFTASDNYHVTLHFLGETDPSSLIYIQSAMDSVKRLPAPEMAVSQICVMRSANLVCAKYKYGAALTELHEALGARLEQDGFTVEHRAYRPHTTLVRKYCFTLPFSEVTKTVSVYNMPFYASDIVLYESVQGKNGVGYREIYSVTLSDPREKG